MHLSSEAGNDGNLDAEEARNMKYKNLLTTVDSLDLRLPYTNIRSLHSLPLVQTLVLSNRISPYRVL